MMLAVIARQAPYRSPIAAISDEAWSAFVREVGRRDEFQDGRWRDVPRAIDEVSRSGALGMYALPPRRLVEIGWMLASHALRLDSGRMGRAGTFVPSVTREAFLRNPEIQYAALRDSLRTYADKIRSGAIMLPLDTGFAAGLAVLHRAGEGGLRGERFPETEALVRRVVDIF